MQYRDPVSVFFTAKSPKPTLVAQDTDFYLMCNFEFKAIVHAEMNMHGNGIHNMNANAALASRIG